jgi:hypothetical protein
MKKLNLLVFALAMTALSGCSVVTGIFKAGAYTAIIGIVIFIAIIIWIMSMFRRK